MSQIRKVGDAKDGSVKPGGRAPELFRAQGGGEVGAGSFPGGDQAGVAIAGESWAIPAAALGPFLAEIPPPLGFTRVRLEDGSAPLGFIAEPAGIAGLPDISATGGWRAHLESK